MKLTIQFDVDVPEDTDLAPVLDAINGIADDIGAAIEAEIREGSAEVDIDSICVSEKERN